MSVWERRSVSALHAAVRSTDPTIARSIHYSQATNRWSGITEHLLPPRFFPPHADCSSFVTWLFWQARVRIDGHQGEDVVNGLDWRAGNTSSMLRNGSNHQHGPWSWIPGETVVFYDLVNSKGFPTGVVDHCALFVGHNRVVSNGQEIDPAVRPYNYRHVWGARRYHL